MIQPKHREIWIALLRCLLIAWCVGQFCPGLQQCKGKGPAQYLV